MLKRLSRNLMCVKVRGIYEFPCMQVIQVKLNCKLLTWTKCLHLFKERNSPISKKKRYVYV